VQVHEALDKEDIIMMSQGTMTCRSKFITKKKVYLIAILNFLLTPRKISYIFIMDNFYAS